jgi:beta-xylosidase
MKKILIAILAMLSIGLSAQNKQIINGVEHFDTRGVVINAHGAGFIQVGDYYYWVGENRKDGILVSLYRSKDLMNWEFRGDLLTRDSHEDLRNANIERPKIIYNDKTKKFVMWMHYEHRRDYSLARAAIAWSDDIEKPFNYIKSFRPFGNMSRDCTAFKDVDGKAYFFSAARENYDLAMYELTDDYLDVKEHITTLWPGGHREAPTIVKHKNNYFLFTSGCTGWNPNQMKYAWAPTIRGPWSELIDIGDNITFGTQPTYIITNNGSKETSYLYVGDRWDAKNYFNSKYIFLPLGFKDETTPIFEWKEKVIPNTKTGIILSE